MVKSPTPTKRKRRVEAQFSEDEFFKLLHLAADSGNTTVAGFVRKRALSSSDSSLSIDDLKFAAWMRDYLYELNKIGVNLNQVAANINTYGLQTRKITNELQAIRVELNFHRDWFFARYDKKQ